MFCNSDLLRYSVTRNRLFSWPMMRLQCKKSIWVSRRAAVLRDAVDQGEVDFIKIDRGDNVADYLTRANTHAELTHFMEYLHPIAHMAQWTPQHP